MATSEDLRRTYRFGTFVIWPPDDLRTEVNRLRQRYDPASQTICDAHITLTSPLLRNPGDEDWQAIDAVAGRHAPFTVRYGPLDTFLPYPCVYLRIAPPEPLRRLRADLLALGLFDLSQPYSDPAEFIPHMSITDGYPDDRQSRLILDALRDSEPLGEFLVTRIAYIRPDERFHFSERRNLRLRGTV